MPSTPDTPAVSPITGAQAVVEGLVRNGIVAGFGIPSIHNIALYEALRQTPNFRHWVVRHEQAAGFAADGYARRSGGVAAVFASTGPGNLFTLVPLLESLQTDTPVLVIGTNIASLLMGKSGGALHETPRQLEVIQPLTRFARRVNAPDEIPEVMAAAAEVLRSSTPGPAFVEIPHDFLLAPVTVASPQRIPAKPAIDPSLESLASAMEMLAQSKKPVVVVGGGVKDAAGSVLQLAKALQAPVFSTTSGKGLLPDDDPLAMGCISRQGLVRAVFEQSDLLISCGARFTEFDTGRFQLALPARHLQVVSDRAYPGERIVATQQLAGCIASTIEKLTAAVRPRPQWFDVGTQRCAEQERIRGLHSDAYAALELLRAALDRTDVIVNDQSILNYWASAFFSALAPRTFLYPLGSGTLGYGLPAAIGAACADEQAGSKQKIVCIAGDGGFQYTQHELATLAQYRLPVKILLVNDDSYGIIGFLQRTLFGTTHEVSLKNPDFCRIAEAYGIQAQRVRTLDDLRNAMPSWLSSSGPGLLEWQTELKSPWEAGAVPVPAQPQQKK